MPSEDLKQRIIESLGVPPGAMIWTGGEPAADMSEDQLNKRMEELESAVMAALVITLREQPARLPGVLLKPIERYGELWDESWTR